VQQSVGAAPVTDLFAKNSLAVENGIVVNEYLETNQAGIFAAGDVANCVDGIFDKDRLVEHWDNAVSQGQQLFLLSLVTVFPRVKGEAGGGHSGSLPSTRIALFFASR
jgi:NADPH-dependent 2,4-dienoyl-CoA reductase/sulfur reductase-like enzyme